MGQRQQAHPLSRTLPCWSLLPTSESRPSALPASVQNPRYAARLGISLSSGVYCLPRRPQAAITYSALMDVRSPVSWFLTVAKYLHK